MKNHLSHQFGTKDQSLIRELFHFGTSVNSKLQIHSSLLFRSPLNSTFNYLYCFKVFDFALDERFH